VSLVPLIGDPEDQVIGLSAAHSSAGTETR
jgi:hypothetical protein